MPHREPSGWPWLRERLVRLRQGSRDSIPEAAPAAVVQVAVVTDSAAALPADWVRAFAADGGLTVVPMPVMVGAEIYGEGEDDIAETIAVALASGKPVKTSRPSPGQFEHAYRAGQRAWLPVRGLHSHLRGAVRDCRRRPPGSPTGRHPGRGPRLPDGRNGPGDGRAGRGGRGRRRQERGRRVGLRAGPAGPHQSVLLCSEPGTVAPGRPDRGGGLALGDHVLHQTHPGG